ncbi:hypothetical protein [Coxiella burnetii]|uniref:hypothetical protein n=1 Tax=Coxiella burnetii TaxID=777 RepID=UPI000589F247|nr:hypothetical protein [Coxiella burnetii]ATN85216.1 hypothetical protein AYO29_01185 [Coxiella burnetii str. Schperling]
MKKIIASSLVFLMFLPLLALSQATVICNWHHETSCNKVGWTSTNTQTGWNTLCSPLEIRFIPDKRHPEVKIVLSVDAKQDFNTHCDKKDVLISYSYDVKNEKISKPVCYRTVPSRICF